jgi:hypothetical protein
LDLVVITKFGRKPGEPVAQDFVIMAEMEVRVNAQLGLTKQDIVTRAEHGKAGMEEREETRFLYLLTGHLAHTHSVEVVGEDIHKRQFPGALSVQMPNHGKPYMVPHPVAAGMDSALHTLAGQGKSRCGGECHDCHQI